jgi:hypothetical protein
MKSAMNGMNAEKKGELKACKVVLLLLLELYFLLQLELYLLLLLQLYLENALCVSLSAAHHG